MSGASTLADEELLQTVTEILLALQDVLALKDGKVHDDIHRGWHLLKILWALMQYCSA